jgi:hypothetical protein
MIVRNMPVKKTSIVLNISAKIMPSIALISPEKALKAPSITRSERITEISAVMSITGPKQRTIKHVMLERLWQGSPSVL